MLSSWIFEVVDLYLKNEKSAALISREGDILHAKSDLGFEVTGFKYLTENSLKYISLKPGEILITNDSYSGGSFLHRYSFLMPLTSAEGTHPGLLLCVRREFAPGLNISAKLDDEGLRIPPTPIFQGGQLVTPIIEAMSMHPLCPQGFKAWLQNTVAELGDLHKKWMALEKNCKFSLTSNEIKKFISFSQKYSADKIQEKAQGESRAEVRLDSGEVLKLHLEVHNGLVKADFSGSSPGFKTHLPDLATFGACYAALASFYGLTCFKTTGSFSVLQVTKPLGCFLNAKYPSSTHQGFHVGVAAVQMAMNMALHQIVKNTNPLFAENDIKIEMAFTQGGHWLSHWSAKACCESVSVENIEAKYPVQILKMEKTQENMHFALEFKTLAACQIRWLTDFTVNTIRPPRGMKTPTPTKIESLNDKGEWIPLPSQGSTDLLPGTRLRVDIHGSFAQN
ncbi:hydantoinase B/oxoprolinase family protein [Bdellovibrio sp. HCB337]|uniref:hydantoinase B/oxoprolinase family protein n=1 Tax=Bdellovibrio sp. HCB337 TaxID=3394358 RepID=UPI0039A75B65